MVEIKNLLDTFNGELYDLCYKLIDENDNALEVFQYVCENFKSKPKNKSLSINKYFSVDEINEYKSILGAAVDGLLCSTIKKCNYGFINPNSFYKELWQSYCTNFITKKEIAFAFYYTIIDSQIPYEYLGKPLNMDNDKFKEFLDKNEKYIKKLKYIARSQFEQKTESVSLVLHCLDEIEEYESKVVVLVSAFQIFSKQSSNKIDVDELIERIDKRIEELEQEEENPSPT